MTAGVGPLAGVRVVELSGLGPGPFCGMVLADLGADVVRVDRPGVPPTGGSMTRGKRSVELDLKSDAGREAMLSLLSAADALIDVYRPGVLERLGLGPEVLLERNPRLVYGRLTGWGQDGPLAPRAGHDINYIAIGGALEPVGRAGQPPTPALNLIGDFAGGAVMLALGIACALLERERSGQGQVIDAAMVDGAALLMAPLFGTIGGSFWTERGTNMLDSGAPYYDVYECADGGWLSVGAIEDEFWKLFLAGIGLADDADLLAREREQWPALKERVAAVIRTRTRDEWEQVFDGVDACVAPALPLADVVTHPHNVARGSVLQVDGQWQPAPAPRFSRTVPEAGRGCPTVDLDALLGEWAP